MQCFFSIHLGRFVAAALLGSALVACGGSGPDMDLARRFVDQGQLERAQAMLVDDPSVASATLREEIEQRLAARVVLQASMAELAEMDPWDAQDRLKGWLANESDPWSQELIKLELSAAVDRAAALGSAGRLARREKQDREAQRQWAAEQAAAEAATRRAQAEALVAQAAGAAPVVQIADASGADSAELVEPLAETALPVVEPEESNADPDPVAALPDPEPPIVTRLDLIRPELESAEKVLKKAKSAKREEALEALADYGELAEPFIARALRARWEEATGDAIKNKTVRALEKLAQDREELDFRRKNALTLIFDKVTYFYPYRPPECPPEKAREYGAVQRRVDDLVAELRDAWEVSRTVKLPGSFHELLEELRWLQERSAEHSLALSMPELLPSRLLTIGPETRSLNVRSFAWNAAEAEGLARDGQVRAYNQHVWLKEVQEALEQKQDAAREEQEQVQITNAYRRMFGRRALAWNPLLQEAADGHSDYMARTGKFGHNEEGDPERRSPFDRMNGVGYNRGVSENCAMGTGSPQGAHDGWARSSGHHRNLLMPTHTEMGSAVGGSYWTQNFGADRAFENELNSWQD